VNISTKKLKLLVNEREGLTPKELKGEKQRRGPNRATIRMRSKAFAEWTSEDLNWMYRQLSYINKVLLIDEPLFRRGKNDEKVPTDKLTSLIAWGHCPSGIKFSVVDDRIVLK
jgi:hypothetical protein